MRPGVKLTDLQLRVLGRLDDLWVTVGELDDGTPDFPQGQALVNALNALRRRGFVAYRRQDEGGTDGLPAGEWTATELGDRINWATEVDP